MKRHNVMPLAAAGLAAVVALPACSGSGPPIPQQTPAGYDAALNAVVNPSAHRGGTIIFDNNTVPDSTDPGNTYYAYTWNTVRLYGRTLVTYKSVPGAAGRQLVPDLATSLGTVSDHGLAWTYHLKPGITSKTAPQSPAKTSSTRSSAATPRTCCPTARRTFSCCSTTPPIPAHTRTRHPAGWA